MAVLVTRSFVRSFLAYIELKHGSLCPLVRCCATKLPAPTVDQLQHCSIYSTNNSFLGQASTLETTQTPLPVKPKYCTTGTSIIQLSLQPTTTTNGLYQPRRPPADSTNIDDHELSPPSTTIPLFVFTISILYKTIIL